MAGGGGPQVSAVREGSDFTENVIFTSAVQGGGGAAAGIPGTAGAYGSTARGGRSRSGSPISSGLELKLSYSVKASAGFGLLVLAESCLPIITWIERTYRTAG